MRTYERLYADEASKDVTIAMSDGLINAHSVLLCASSDAIRGQLAHGRISAESGLKRLSWTEHSVVVGRFLLSLLYLNGEAEWDGDDEDVEVPIRILIGALTIAKMNLMDDAVAVLTGAINDRLSTENFEEVLASAIKIDHTVLRTFCIDFAKKGTHEFKVGDRVVALCDFEVEEAALLKGDKGTVQSDEGDELEVCWERNGYLNTLSYVIGMVKPENADTVKDNTVIRSRYEAGGFAPEVLSELAGLWDPLSPGSGQASSSDRNQGGVKRRRVKL